MKRRDFISTSMTAAAGSTLLMNSGASLLARGQEKTQPLYFDGLTWSPGARKGIEFI